MSMKYSGVSADVIIVGGGVSALVTGLKAKEEFPEADILLIDKQTVGWSGKAPKIGSGVSLRLPDEDVDKIAEYHVRNIGCYLNDQELLDLYIRESYGAIKQLRSGG